ncbi:MULTISPECIES: helix-turn-helix transcriptional regulator [unclassified Streptomyces]|uniref:helix-turn-helix transcriptional regulator n=1 Tax=unclassified Streptomyces TaxID=2593676 RepID=UPI0004C18876|nr:MULTISPECIES: LuxR C-terminal-related transcriptional regulator [unclassified Streptomyces]
MSGVPGGAYERMLSLAVAALHERDPDQMWPLVAETLPALCGGESLIYKLGEWDGAEGEIGLPAALPPEALGAGALTLLREGYPFARHYGTGADRTPVTARRAAGRAWSASPTADMLGRVMDADHVLAIPLPRPVAPVTGCLLYRPGADFTEDELRLAERIQPLLAAVEEQRGLLGRWRATTVGGERSTDAGRPSRTAAYEDRTAAYEDRFPTPEDLTAECRLTPREVTVLLLLAEALTADAIGRRLGISPRTVHKHVENLYRKLGTRDRVDTVLRAQRLGLLPVPAPGA